MKFKLIYFLTILTLFSFNTSVQANDNPIAKGSIKGTIIDQQSNTPVSYATVVLIDSNSKNIGGGLTDDNGSFVIRNVQYGEYSLQVQFVGYKNLTQTVKVEKQTTNLGNIILAPNVEELEEVVVQGEKTSIERSIDKKVVNVSEAMIADGNSVSEVLQTIPEISVDSDGSISLRGESNVRVLIDGKPSQIDPAQIFQTLPAGSIKKIEVITNPSAKYDPDGLSGIINVITKKDKMKGMNGSLNVGAGSGEKYNGYLGLNYRVNKFNFFGQGSYGENRFENQNDRKRTLIGETSPSFDQDGTNIRNGRYYNYKFGLDYFLDSTNTITVFTEQWNWKGSNENFYMNRNFTTGGEMNTENETGGSQNDASGYSISLNYRKEFKKGVLETDLYYNSGSSVNSSYTSIENDPLRQGENNTNSDWDYATAKVDYSQDINDKSSFEVGYKGELTNAEAQISNSYGESTTDYIYNYDQMINSLYVSYSLQLGNFSVKAGLRSEMAQIDGTLNQESLKDTTFNITYNSLFPTVHLQQQIGENNTIGLSYSRRINRPNIFYLLPIEQRSNSSTMTVGNPSLQPSYTNSISFDHGLNKNKLGLNTSIYLRHSTDIIRSVSTYDEEEDLTIYTYENLGSSITGGASISANYQLTDWWSIDANMNIFYLDIEDDNEDFVIPEDANPFNWEAKLNTRLNLPKSITLQIMGRYSGQQYDAQRITAPRYALNLAIKKQVLKKKGNISFKIDDIINSGDSKTIYGNGFTENTYYLQERPVYRFSFSYAFGGQFQGRRARKLNSSGGGLN